MEARIVFDAHIYIDGKDINEIREKFEDMPLFSIQALDCGIEFIDYLAIENADNNEDLTNEFFKRK